MNRLLQPAKEFLKEYFSDGVKRSPSDLEDDILGGMDINFLLLGRPRWHKTPFFEALGELVEEGIVHFSQQADGQCVYCIPIK